VRSLALACALAPHQRCGAARAESCDAAEASPSLRRQLLVRDALAAGVFDEAVNPLDRVGVGEVDTLEKLAALDQDEIVRGYLVGFDKHHGHEVPIGETTSFYHGWLNAQVDRGRMKSSAAQTSLAREYVDRSRLPPSKGA